MNQTKTVMVLIRTVFENYSHRFSVSSADIIQELSLIYYFPSDFFQYSALLFSVVILYEEKVFNSVVCFVLFNYTAAFGQFILCLCLDALHNSNAPCHRGYVTDKSGFESLQHRLFFFYFLLPFVINFLNTVGRKTGFLSAKSGSESQSLHKNILLQLWDFENCFFFQLKSKLLFFVI